MKKINIRKAEIGDAKTLAYIQTQSWKDAFGQIISSKDLEEYSNFDKAKDMYQMLLDKNIANGYILSIDETPYCTAYWDKVRELEEEKCCELICIHSLSDNWGNGYGKIMMEYVLKQMKKEQFEKVVLWVFEENIRARNFYENQGFILTEKSKEFCNAVEIMYCKEI